MDKEEKGIRKEIRKAVEKELKPFGAIRRKTVKGLCASAYHAYLHQVELETPKNEALENALGSMKETVVERYGKKKYNRFIYSLFVSSVFLVAAITISVFGSLSGNIRVSFCEIYVIFSLATLVYFIYTTASYKKRTPLDFVIASIVLISVLATAIQCIRFFNRADTSAWFHAAYYDFPGLIRFCTFWYTSIEPISYELRETIYLFDSTLFTSLPCFCISMAMFFKERRKYVNRDTD